MSNSDKELYLVSPCIFGIPTRWDGEHCLEQRLVQLAAEGRVIPFCPEAAGGLSIPRPEAEIMGEDGHAVLDGEAQVVSIEEVDVTPEYVRGAELGLALARKYGIKRAILKAYSPACGSRQIYDGTFSLTLKPGQGVFAALLARNGITIYSENDLDSIPELTDAD